MSPFQVPLVPNIGSISPSGHNDDCFEIFETGEAETVGMKDLEDFY
jgi:hypothetical protein